MKSKILRTAALFALALLALFAAPRANAQLNISNSATNYLINFSTTISGVNNGVFNGTGFAPTPSSGQLDSDAWAGTGMDSANFTFGGTTAAGDWQRGSSFSTTGGLYGLTVSGDTFLAIRPGASDWTPGTLTLRVQNNSGSTITGFDFSYDIKVLNDQGRANSFNFAWSLDDINYTSISALNYTSPAAATVGATWETIGRTNVFSSLTLSNSAYIYLRWLGDDVSGTGSRDGFGLDNISLSNFTAASLVGNYWAGAAGGGGSGIWTSSSTNWATNVSGAGRGGAQATSGALIFTNTAGTVDVGGPVTVNAGMQFATDGYTVRSNTITLAGANTAANTITTDANVGTTINSVLAGSAGMTKAGNGTLTLGGANTYTGGTLVSAGRLVGSTTSLQGSITNNAAVTFDQAANGSYTGLMSGSGSLTKSGAATLTTTAANTFSGATTVSAGRLVVNGTNASSAVTVNSGGASLAGSGTVGALTVSGLLAPGTSIGTLSAGSTAFNGGGSFELEIFDWVSTAGTGWDLFAVTGDLTLNNTAGSPFTINLVSLQNSTTPGLSTEWDQNVNFTNTFVTVSGSLLGNSFAPNLFTVNTNGFQNTVNGTFSITNIGNNLALLYTTSFVPASEYIWNSGAGAWGTAGSWSGGVAPSNNSAIIFSGAGGASTNNLVNAVQSLLFSNTAGSYTISGDALTVGALGIDNESTAAQTIDNNLTLGAAQSFLAANGNLTFGGTVDNGGFLLTVAGASNTVVNGAISGTGGLTKSGTGSLTLGGNNTFTGALAASAGTTLVNGTQATTTINVGGGTLLLGASDRLANGSTVALTSGTVNFGGNSDTITTFNQSGGTFTNGTLSANTYGLSGGTVGGTLSGGTANVTGAVSLSGAIDSTLNVNSGGTLTLASNDRIGNSSVVTVNAGTLATATFNDTVSSVVLTNSGAITGTGTITAGTYTLNGGTVSANLGGGTATSSAGTTTLNGTLAGDLAVSGGTLTLGGNDRISASSAVTVSSGTLDFGGFSDTVGSFGLSGGVFTNGTVTTTTYSLSGGTVGGTLGAGTANVTGGVTLSGVLNSALNINSGGTLTLAAADRITNGGAVTINAGTLATATFNDTVGSLLLTNAGTITGSGTITAGTYTLNGGTVSANLGAGTANVSAGTTTLSGTFAATTLNIDGGTLALGGNGRIDNATVVNLSSGVLDMGTFIDSVGTFNMTGGTVNGSGANSLGALNGLNLQAGTVNANIGNSSVSISNGTTTVNGTVGGAVIVSSGTANLNGALSSTLTASGGTANVAGALNGNLSVSGGTVNLNAADLVTNTASVSVSAGSLNLNGNESVGAVTLTGGTIGGSGTLTGTSYAVQSGTIATTIGGSNAMTKTGVGTTTLSANNSSYSGAVAVNNGSLLATTSGALGTGAVTMTNGSTLAGSGVTLANDFTIGAVAGVGTIYSENFNSIGTSATDALPTGWKMSAAGQGSTSTFWTNTANITATTQAASSGSPTAGGAYNWGFSADTNNRSIGFMSSGSYAEPNSIMFAFTNTTGQALTNFTVAFDYLRFRTNTVAISNVFYVSDSTTSWGTALSTNNWSTGTSGYNFAPVAVSLSNTISLNIANGGVAYLMWTFDATGGANGQGLGLDNVLISGMLPASGSGTLGIDEAGTATFSGNIVNNNAATFTAASGGLATFSGAISGAGTLAKTGNGTVTLSGASANTFTNMTTVSAGTLQLNKSTGVNAIAGNIALTNSAVLLLSSSGNVADTSAVTLSGGTITRGGNVSEVFGSLNVTVNSFLDYGADNAVGTLSFDGTYTESALLTVQNFLPGNKLQFAAGFNSALLPTGGSLSNDNFSFSNGFTTGTEGGFFTITAIPEPSTYLAAAGLLGLMIWPSRKRLIRDAKKILGITPPMRDRLAARSKA